MGEFDYFNEYQNWRAQVEHILVSRKGKKIETIYRVIDITALHEAFREGKSAEETASLILADIALYSKG